MREQFHKSSSSNEKHDFSAMVMTKDKDTLYACTNKNDYRVTKYSSDETSSYWEKVFDMPRTYNDNVEYLLQLKLDREEEMLLATTGNGFIAWFLESKSDAHVLMLPNGVRNISTRMMYSNSIMVSGAKNYAVAGVRCGVNTPARIELSHESRDQHVTFNCSS